MANNVDVKDLNLMDPAVLAEADLVRVHDVSRGQDYGIALSDIFNELAADASSLATIRADVEAGTGTYGQMQVDNILINGNTISSTAGTDLNITPLAGQQIVLDGVINVDAGVVTAVTDLTSDNVTVNTLLDAATATVSTATVSGSLSVGAAAAGVNASTKITKNVNALADTVATSVLTITVPNAAHSAVVRITLLGALGAGGTVGAREATGTISYDVVIGRTAGVNAVGTASSAYGSAVMAVAGADTITIAGALGSVTGAVDAANTFLFTAAITKGGGASDNHTVVVMAEVLNAAATGVGIS